MGGYRRTRPVPGACRRQGATGQARRWRRLARDRGAGHDARWPIDVGRHALGPVPLRQPALHRRAGYRRPRGLGPARRRRSRRSLPVGRDELAGRAALRSPRHRFEAQRFRSRQSIRPAEFGGALAGAFRHARPRRPATAMDRDRPRRGHVARCDGGGLRKRQGFPRGQRDGDGQRAGPARQATIVRGSVRRRTRALRRGRRLHGLRPR